MAQATSLTVDPRLYITGPKAPEMTYEEDTTEGSISAESPMVEKDKPNPPAYSALRIAHGRPSVRKILEEEITTSPGPVSVDGEHTSHSCKSI